MPESLPESLKKSLLGPWHEPCSPGFQRCKVTGANFQACTRKHPGSGLAKNRKLQCSGAPGLQDSKFDGSKVAGLRIQGCRFPWCQSSKISDFRGLYRAPGHKPFAGWSPCRNASQEFLAGSVTRTSPDHNKTCGFSLNFAVLVCFFCC